MGSGQAWVSLAKYFYFYEIQFFIVIFGWQGDAAVITVASKQDGSGLIPTQAFLCGV